MNNVKVEGKDFDIKMFMNEYKYQDKKENFEKKIETIHILPEIENILFDYQINHFKK